MINQNNRGGPGRVSRQCVPQDIFLDMVAKIRMGMPKLVPKRAHASLAGQDTLVYPMPRLEVLLRKDIFPSLLLIIKCVLVQSML